MPTKVIMLPLSISNAYLLLGDRPVLIDAGAPKDGDRLVAALRQHSITPKDLSPIAVTHGHTDHTGAVAAVAADGVPVAISATDAPLLHSGANGVLPPTGPAGAGVPARMIHKDKFWGMRNTAPRHDLVHV